MKTKRQSIPKAVEHQLREQCGQACANPDCRKSNTATHELHHIDNDRSRSVLENLILLCANCHSEEQQGIISPAKIDMWKRMAEFGYLRSQAVQHPPTSTVMRDNHGIVAEQVHVGNLTVNLKKELSGKAPMMPGTVGADADMRDYANYLVKRYIAWRKKGIEKGIDRRRFVPASAQGILCEGLGAESAHMVAQKRFFDWVSQAQRKIDATVWGKMNRHRNYHTWEEHLKERHGD
jgi:hypothetical protein